MPGCDFLKKSFSVSMQGSTIAYCAKCNVEIKDTAYKYNGDYLCRVCFSKVPSKIISKIKGNFFTSKDKLWEFTDLDTTGRPVQFTSKGQWKRHLKKLGLHDDIKVCKRVEDIPQQKFKSSKEDVKKIILENIRERRRIRL